MLDHKRLVEVLRYDAETGDFFWIAPRGSGSGLAGGKNASGYIQIQIDGENHYGHRLAWLYVHGHWPSASIDHINGVRHDNRFTNLRDVPHRHNLQNRQHAPVNSTSGAIGVSRSGSRWRAYINIDEKQKHLGCYATKDEASAVAIAARAIHFPGFVHAA